MRVLTSLTFRLVFIPLGVLVFSLLGCAGGVPPAGGDAGTGEAPKRSSVLPWQSGGLKVGYVRSDQIAQEYPDYRDADMALRNDNRKWMEQASDLEKKIRDKEKELDDLALILSNEQKTKLQGEIKQANKDLQDFRNNTWYDENSEYVKRRKELMEPIDARVNDAIYKVAEDKGLDMVFDTISGNIVYAKPGLDITLDVLEELKK